MIGMRPPGTLDLDDGMKLSGHSILQIVLKVRRHRWFRELFFGLIEKHVH